MAPNLSLTHCPPPRHCSWAGAAADAAAYCRSRGMPATAALLQQRVLPALEGVKPGACQHSSGSGRGLIAQYSTFFLQRRRMHAAGAALNLALILAGAAREGFHLIPMARCAGWPCPIARYAGKKASCRDAALGPGIARAFRFSGSGLERIGVLTRRYNLPTLGRCWASRLPCWPPWPCCVHGAPHRTLPCSRCPPWRAFDSSSPGW